MKIEMIPIVLRPLARELKYIFIKDKYEEFYNIKKERLFDQWKRIIDNSQELISEPISTAIEGTRIMFVTGYGVMGHYQAVEPMIMMSLYVRGASIVSLYCDISLPSCEFNPVGNNNPASINSFKKGIRNKSILSRCVSCKENLELAYSILPIEMLSLKKYLLPEDYYKARNIAQSIHIDDFRQFKFKGIAVGEEAFASILRVTFLGEVVDNEINRHLVARYIMSGILTVIGYERAFLEEKPDRVACVHGVYQSHGLAIKVANKLGIPSIVMGGGGIRKDTVVMCHKETYHHQLVDEPNSLWENNILSECEKKRVIDYAEKKRNSGAGVDYLNYHPNPIEDEKTLLDNLGIDNSRKIVSLYTNVIWDAQILYEGNAFKDIFEWISVSIEELGKNENVWVVIRIHPAESKGAMPSLQPMEKEIQKRFPTLPPNVKIISPESDLSSYTLARKSHANIIYGTKMGLELALMKTPLIICGETFSRNKGYGLDVVSKGQYIKILGDIHNYTVDLESKYERALKYADYFYFRRMLDLPIETKNPGTGKEIVHTELKIDSLNDLKPGKIKTVDVICDGILNLKDFIL